MNTTGRAAFLALIALAGSGCYAYAGPPRHTHGRVVVHERPRHQPVVVVHEHRPPPRVVVRERVVERRHHRRHDHHHGHD